MEVTFILQQKNKSKLHQIFMVVSDRGLKPQVKYYTGRRILPSKDHWNKSKYKGVGSYYNGLNSRLSSLEGMARNVFDQLEKECKIGRDEFIRRLLIMDGKEHRTKKDNKNFFDCFEQFIEESKSRVNPVTGESLVSKTIAHYQSCLNILKEFDPSLSFETIDMKFYAKFRTWFLEKRNQNTFGGKIRMIKTFLSWAIYQGLPVNIIYKKFERPQKYSDAEPLTAEELISLWNLKLELNPELRKPLDIFLFLCSTGLRISDYNSLKPEYFKGDHIKIKSQKTSGECIIPFFDDHYFRPKFIYDKYKGKLPTLSGQKLNPCLTKIAGVAKIKRIDITSKTGRKTFATLKLLSGVSAFTIMRSTGHRDYKSFRAYVGISPDDVIKENKEKATYLKKAI